MHNAFGRLRAIYFNAPFSSSFNSCCVRAMVRVYKDGRDTNYTFGLTKSCSASSRKDSLGEAISFADPQSMDYFDELP